MARRFPYFKGLHFGSNLSSVEQEVFLSYFPKATAVVRNIVKLAPENKYEISRPVYPTYCNLYGCDLTKHAIKNEHDRLRPVSADVCKRMPGKCIDIDMVGISYNCI